MNTDLDHEKRKAAEWKKEHDDGGFTCAHCGQWVVIDKYIGTAHRNQCSSCLWSKHVDEEKGDRLATCYGTMEPIGLAFKAEGSGKQGEIMLVHKCTTCGKLSINRIARDDSNEEILAVFVQSLALSDENRQEIRDVGIEILTRDDESEVKTQLFGK